jgi:outer membrane receptor protein involved in Fe transport
MVSGYAIVLGGIYARNALGKSVALSTIPDIGIYGEYGIVSRLSGFLQVSNLLNNKYQRWYGYEAYGLNIYAGLRLKF